MVLFEMTPITYSGEHLPLFATDGNPEGSRTAWTIVFCSWTCSWVRGQQWVSVHRGRSAPTRESLCWHCVWILWTMLSQTRRGWWPNQSPCYWNRTGDYSSWPLWYWPTSDLFFTFSILVLGKLPTNMNELTFQRPKLRLEASGLFMIRKWLSWHKLSWRYFKLSYAM